MQIDLTEEEKGFIINECLDLLNSTKDCNSKPEGDVTMENYSQFKYEDFSGDYGIPKEDYDKIISILNKLH